MASNDPLRQMAQCHEKIAAHLARLDALAAAGDGARAELEAALPAMVRWFETNGLRHRMDEEESLFPRLAARFEDCEAIIYGHTHVPQVEHFQHLWILNPGSPTERRSAPVHSMLVLRVRGSRVTPELVTL